MRYHYQDGFYNPEDEFMRSSDLTELEAAQHNINVEEELDLVDDDLESLQNWEKMSDEDIEEISLRGWAEELADQVKEQQTKPPKYYPSAMGYTQFLPIDNSELLGTNPKDLIGSKKPSISLVPPVGIIQIAEAMRNGAEKYGAYNFRGSKVQYTVYLDAILRHTLALIDGEDRAKDSDLHHLAHIGANVAILLDTKETGNLIDDRPKKGNASEVIERHTRK